MDAVTRRTFLARASMLGAFVGGSVMLPLASPSAPRAAAQGSAAFDAVEAFSLDTMRGICVMVMPGPDQWSARQGTLRTDPGPIEVGGGEFIKDLFDNYLAMGDQLARPLALGLAQALSDLGIPAAPFLGLSDPEGRRIDEIIGYEYSDRVLPLSLPIALLVNIGALLAVPGAIVGPLGSPFSRLSLADKLRVLQAIEGPVPELVSIIDSALPVPFRASASGFLRFAGGILLEGTAFSVYSEMNAYDPTADEVYPRPISWDLTGYRPNGLVDGHDEFIGYHQGRTEVPADA